MHFCLRVYDNTWIPFSILFVLTHLCFLSTALSLYTIYTSWPSTRGAETERKEIHDIESLVREPGLFSTSSHAPNKS